MPANLENSAVATGLQKVFSFQSQRKAMQKNAQTTAQLLSSHAAAAAAAANASKVMLKILQARLQQYVNHEVPDVQAGFRKGRGIRDQIVSICWIIKKAGEFQTTIYFCFIDYAKALTVLITTNWEILKEMRIPDHLTCLLRNLYAGQEGIVRTGHRTTDWFQSRKGVCQAVYCHPDYLIYMQSTSCEMPGCMRCKLESRLLGEIAITSDMQMTPSLWQKASKN